MSETFKEEIYLEIKKYYYKAFRRRGKSLQTLELIQECSEDQFKLFINQTINLIKKSLKINDEIKIYKLLQDQKKLLLLYLVIFFHSIKTNQKLL